MRVKKEERRIEETFQFNGYWWVLKRKNQA